MANKIIEQIHQHRSIRRYKSDPVPEELLEEILQAALRASSSGNMQTYSVIITKDPAIRRRLFEPHFEQAMVLQAPLFLTFCADFHRMHQWLEQNDASMNFDNGFSFMVAAIDAILASGNAAIAAESLGLGLCYLGTTLASSNKIGHILNCPAHVVPVVGFCLGWPDEDVEPRDRLPLHGIVHRDCYKDYNIGEIKDIYRERDRKGMERYQSVPSLKKEMEDNQIDNLAQVYTKLKYTRTSHIHYTNALKSYLKHQGFGNCPAVTQELSDNTHENHMN